MTLAPRALTAPVVTVLEPEERLRVDAAGAGLYRTIHRESVAGVHDELRRRRVSAVLVSVARCGRDTQERQMATLVREFPSVPTVALLGAVPPTAESLLHLGNAGVTRLVDVRIPAGWNRLRQLLGGELLAEVDQQCLDAVRAEIGEMTPDGWRFFEAIFVRAERVSTIRTLATRLGILPSTLMSRFHRAGLPAPKQYLCYARLLRAARLLEDPGHSLAGVSHALRYSSPQSFGRHIRMLLGMSAGEFRARHDFTAMRERFLADLVRPYRHIWRGLRPLAVRPGMLVPPTVSSKVPPKMPPSVADGRPAWARRTA